VINIKADIGLHRHKTWWLASLQIWLVGPISKTHKQFSE